MGIIESNQTDRRRYTRRSVAGSDRTGKYGRSDRTDRRCSTQEKVANRKGGKDTISNGAVIHVYEGQFMMLLDGGRIVGLQCRTGVFYCG